MPNDFITIGFPVVALYASDLNFYRAIVTNLEDLTTVRVSEWVSDRLSVHVCVGGLSKCWDVFVWIVLQYSFCEFILVLCHLLVSFVLLLFLSSRPILLALSCSNFLSSFLFFGFYVMSSSSWILSPRFVDNHIPVFYIPPPPSSSLWIMARSAAVTTLRCGSSTEPSISCQHRPLRCVYYCCYCRYYYYFLLVLLLLLLLFLLLITILFLLLNFLVLQLLKYLVIYLKFINIDGI